MKHVFIAILAFTSAGLLAQPGGKNKEMKMTPEFAKGYYVSLKGDTVKGEVQTNPNKETDLYNTFQFKLKGATKGTEITSKKAQAYGFDDKHFTVLKMDDKDVYIRYLEKGRLNLMEWKYPKDVDGVEKAMPVYFIIDTRATEADKTNTHVLTQLNEMSFKKQLKPFFKDQPVLLDQIDKWALKIDEVRKAVSEFNAMYAN
jgi:hypothetical protein